MVEERGALDDEALAGSRIDGDRFVVVFDLRANEIWRFLAARLGALSADELLSEVFVRAFAARARFDPLRGSARGWLFGIANNLCLERLRSDSHQRQLVDLSKAASSTPAMADAADRIADRHMLGRAMDLLPEERREVIILIAAVGLSYEETAQAVGVPVGTVRSRFFRARRQLRTFLQDERSVNDAERIP